MNRGLRWSVIAHQWWFALVWLCLVLAGPTALSHEVNRSIEKKPLTDCGEKRRYAVCRGAWSGKTVALWDAHREASLRTREKFNHFFFWSALVLLGPIYGGISHGK